MSKIAYSVNKRSGVDFVNPSLAPLNRSAQTRFGLLDGAIIAFFVVVCVAGLVLLLKV